MSTKLRPMGSELEAERVRNRALEQRCSLLEQELEELESLRSLKWIKRLRRVRSSIARWLAESPRQKSPRDEDSVGLPVADPRFGVPGSAVMGAGGAAPLGVSVTVIIPTKNAGPDLADLLSLVRRQRGLGKVETLIIDSGSSDGSLERASSLGARLMTIDPEQFEHAGTRNRAAEQAQGAVLVFLVQDAMPLDENWLYRLVEPIASGLADAVSVRSVPRTDADLYARWSVWAFDRDLGFTTDTLRDGTEYPDLQLLDPGRRRQVIHLDNVCCAVRKEVFSRFLFKGRYAEDLELGLRLIKDGYRLLYQFSNPVAHSHNRPPGYFLRREYVNTLTLGMILGSPQNRHRAELVTPTLCWAYLAFCVELAAWTVRPASEGAASHLTVRTLIERLRHLYCGGGAFGGSDADLSQMLCTDRAVAPNPDLLAVLGGMLLGPLGRFAGYIQTEAHVAPAEVMQALLKFFAVAAGALMAIEGPDLDPEQLRGV